MKLKKEHRTLTELKRLLAQRQKTTPDGIVRIDVSQPELELLKPHYLKTGYSIAHSISEDLQKRGIMRFAISTSAWRNSQPKRRQKFWTVQDAEAAHARATIDPSEMIVLVCQADGKGPATLETWDTIKFHQRKGNCFAASEKWHNEENRRKKAEVKIRLILPQALAGAKVFRVQADRRAEWSRKRKLVWAEWQNWINDTHKKNISIGLTGNLPSIQRQAAKHFKVDLKSIKRRTEKTWTG